MLIHSSKAVYTQMYDTSHIITIQNVFIPLSLLLLSSQVENPSQFIQGYRVLYRQTSGLPSPGPWQIQDLKVASERDITLSGLKKGIVYEIKVRPYFNEFQGADSESMTARTMEEGKRQIHSSDQNQFICQLCVVRNVRFSYLCMRTRSCVNDSSYFYIKLLLVMASWLDFNG